MTTKAPDAIALVHACGGPGHLVNGVGVPCAVAHGKPIDIALQVPLAEAVERVIVVALRGGPEGFDTIDGAMSRKCSLALLLTLFWRLSMPS